MVAFPLQFTPLLIGLLLISGALGVEVSSRLEISPSHSPEEASSPTFQVSSDESRFRYRLRGLETAWDEKPDFMNLVVSFSHEDGKHLDRIAFPVSGTSNGWKNSPDGSQYSERSETISFPPGTDKIQIGFTSSGSPKSLGIYAIKNLSAIVTNGADQKPLLVDGWNPTWDKNYWNQSGTRPSMALEGNNAPRELYLLDSDLKNHADWITSPITASGESITINWQEVFSIGAGGNLNAKYDRLPPGEYHFEAQQLDLMGNPIGEIFSSEFYVPRPLTQTWWFWLILFLALASLVLLIGRSLVARKVRRVIRHTRLIENERLRIAMDLHDDIGTRLSHISLAGSHALMKTDDSKTKESFQEIVNLTGELAGSLSETVWMLSPKNNDLESLIVFLSRIASDLCKSGNIRCRIDAAPINDDVPITQEFRHHFVLSAKEALNNALKHSQGTEIRLQITFKDNNLSVTVADNGVGLSSFKNKTGNGLGSLRERMSDLGGKFSIEVPITGGTAIQMKAPLNQASIRNSS